MQHIDLLLNHYGYIILFGALMIEYIALPLPGEVLLAYSGYLIFQGKLNWFLSVFMATAGSVAGITLAYGVGRFLGTRFFSKYGPYIHMGPEKIEKAAKWFEGYGNRLLLIAYFLPGIKHITGYTAGITRNPYRGFAIYSYIGVFIRVIIFISLGNALGPNWNTFHVLIKRYLIIGCLIIALVIMLVYFYKSHRAQIIAFVVKYLRLGMEIFQSMGKIKVVVAFMAAVFLGLFIVVIGLIQDYLGNEFTQFDKVVMFLVSHAFSKAWTPWMRGFSLLTTPTVYLLLATGLLIWKLYKRERKWLELRFIFIVFIGGQVLEYLLRYIFHQLRPFVNVFSARLPYSFPSEQSLMAVVVYGFAAYMILRHEKRVWLSPVVLCLFVGCCILSGISKLFFGAANPSDVAAGFAFGGVWLSLSIILLEVFRILPEAAYTERLLEGE